MYESALQIWIKFLSFTAEVVKEKVAALATRRKKVEAVARHRAYLFLEMVFGRKR
jgi:hypothetical protein